MQFKVPQFLDIEDKIFGPFTFSEFVYLAGGGGLCFIIYRAAGLFWGFIPIVLIGGLSAGLVFYRPNGKPLIEMIEAGVKYLIQDKLYIWKRSVNKKKTVSVSKTKPEPITNPRLGGDKLRDLAWSLDVLDLKKEGN